MLESILAGTVLHGVKSGVLSSAAVVSKQVVSEAAKETFKALKPTAPPSFGTLMPPLSVLFTGLCPTSSQEDDLRRFFQADAFASFVRSALISGLAPHPNAASDQQLVTLTAMLAGILPGSPLPLIEELGRAIMSLIREAAVPSLSFAQEAGMFDHDWTTFASTQKLIADELSANAKYAAHLSAVPRDQAKLVDASAARYRDAVARQYSHLHPQSLQDEQDAPIEDIYIAPLLSMLGDPQQQALSRLDVVQSIYRTVLLGNPGGGKTTFASKLCHDLAHRYGFDLAGERSVTPILIVLRDYSRIVKSHPLSILDYVVQHCRSSFSLDIGKEVFEALLLTGRALVIFDGLDELIDTADRIAIRDAVQHFAYAYPSAPLLVTSREVGYEQAPLDKERYKVFKLLDFTDEQVAEYASKWFALSREASPEDKTRLAQSFMSESSVISDLRSNPLMLGLLCNIYKQDGYLPNNRPDVYQRCADLLFIKWDRHRGIVANLQMENKLRPAMGHLAHWIYSDDALQAGVPERRLIQEVGTYLNKWREDKDEALAIAEAFVTFFRGRAWVLSDTGSNASEPLYQFTHRTFLEFFTAENIVKTYSQSSSLVSYLLPRVRAREWDVVCQLAFQMNAEATQSHDILVNLLIESVAEQNALTRLRTLSFLLRIIDLLFPTPRVRRMAVDVSLRTLLENLLDAAEENSQLGSVASEMVSALFMATGSEEIVNGDQVVATLNEYVVNHVDDQNALERAFLLAEELPIYIHTVPSSEARRQAWSERVAQFFFLKNEALFASVASTNPKLAALRLSRQPELLSEITKQSGVGICFDVITFPMGRWFRQSFADQIIYALGQSLAAQEGTPQVVESAESFWTTLSCTVFPVSIRYHEFRIMGSIGFLESETFVFPLSLHERELLIVCAMVLAEAGVRVNSNEAVTTSEDFRTLNNIVLSRQKNERRVKAHEDIARLCTAQWVKALSSKWINGEIRFVTLLNKPSSPESSSGEEG